MGSGSGLGLGVEGWIYGYGQGQGQVLGWSRGGEGCGLEGRSGSELG